MEVSSSVRLAIGVATWRYGELRAWSSSGALQAQQRAGKEVCSAAGVWRVADEAVAARSQGFRIRIMDGMM